MHFYLIIQDDKRFKICWILTFISREKPHVISHYKKKILRSKKVPGLQF